MELDFGKQNINAITKVLRKDGLSLKNRLQSIIFDSNYVAAFTAGMTYPIIANERCGLWYVPNDKQAETCYFKSTDGHTNQWSFSLRRLNLHLLQLLAANNGIVIVDSTRKGKTMPDALLKTIPIWCAVINYIMFEGIDTDNEDWTRLQAENWLCSPKEIISSNEHNEMVKRIPLFAQEVKRLGLFTQDRLIQDLGSRKPLIPSWYYPGKEMKKQVNTDHFAILCVTASKKVADQSFTLRHNVDGDQKLTTWYYIQGSADDHELWATKEICQGNLLPKLFWENLYNAQIIDGDTGYIYDWLSDEDLIEKINDNYANFSTNKLDEEIDLHVIQVKNDTNHSNIAFGIIKDNIKYHDIVQKYSNFEQVVVLSKYSIDDIDETNAKIAIFQYEVESSKKGSKQLREIFPKLVPQLDQEKQTLILCDTGKDIGPAFVVLLLCKYYDLEWKRLTEPVKVNKDLIKKHLSLLGDIAKVNPSRNTLQSINTYLMN